MKCTATLSTISSWICGPRLSTVPVRHQADHGELYTRESEAPRRVDKPAHHLHGRAKPGLSQQSQVPAKASVKISPTPHTTTNWNVNVLLDRVLLELWLRQRSARPPARAPAAAPRGRAPARSRLPCTACPSPAGYNKAAGRSPTAGLPSSEESSKYSAGPTRADFSARRPSFFPSPLHRDGLTFVPQQRMEPTLSSPPCGSACSHWPSARLVHLWKTRAKNCHSLVRACCCCFGHGRSTMRPCQRRRSMNCAEAESENWCRVTPE